MIVVRAVSRFVPIRGRTLPSKAGCGAPERRKAGCDLPSEKSPPNVTCANHGLLRKGAKRPISRQSYLWSYPKHRVEFQWCAREEPIVAALSINDSESGYVSCSRETSHIFAERQSASASRGLRSMNEANFPARVARDSL